MLENIGFVVKDTEIPTPALLHTSPVTLDYSLFQFVSSATALVRIKSKAKFDAMPAEWLELGKG